MSVAGLRTSLVKTGVVQARRAAVVTVLLLAMVAAPAWGAPSKHKLKAAGYRVLGDGLTDPSKRTRTPKR